MKKRVLSLLLCLVMALSLIPTMAFAEGTPLAELRLYSTTTTVTAGTLSAFSASTSTEHASVEEYGSNTYWVKRSASGDWNGFSGATPTAVNDGTHYGLCFHVGTDNGYCLDSSTKLYFNDVEIANDIYSLSAWPWGGYVYIDLGTAAGEAVFHNVTFDTRGGSSDYTDIVSDGGKVNKPPFDPTRDGYTFDGWYADESCTVPFDFASAITSDITVYAKWNETIKLAELRLYSTTTTVTAGTLPEFTASTSTEHASVVEYGMNTYWVKRSSGNDWEAFGGATPTAVYDGVTHYGLCFHVGTDNGYCLDSSTKLYFNDVEIANDIYSLSAWPWGGYVYIDLGTAACSHAGTVVTDKAVAATYTKTGKTEGSHCSACKTVIKAQEEVPMLTLKQPTVTLSATSTGITVKWTKVTGATGYQVYRKAGSATTWGDPITTITSGSTVSYTDAKRTNGTKYQYKVRAIAKNSAGTIVNKGAYSSIKTKYFVAQPKISSITNTSTGITVKWGKITGATAYRVYRKAGTGDWKLLKTVTGTSYTNTSLTNGNKYQYKIVAVKKVGTTNYTSADSAIRTMYRLTRPTLSSGTKNIATRKIVVKWNKNDKATGYQVKYVVGSTTKTVKVTSNATLSKTLSSLTKDSTYQVSVRSYKTVGDYTYYSAYSTAKSVKVDK